ncbi:hypothetical protein FSP39_016126 [Pinctada imbricata]|uniref:PH domain-containing protein n=1 Tax=Pinctada imbricata TaxID=66713 RepID=A0AA88Y750_PINIB|nr:hypothetical protein FSP39_016126 [Pinctada imbricata]
MKLARNVSHGSRMTTINFGVQRYASLSEPAQIRRDNLEDASHMYQFYRDVEDELTWIQEKQPAASSTDLGNSLSAVQNLIKKHQALESEIIAHDPLIDNVSACAERMIKAKHFASDDIKQRLDKLHGELQTLTEQSSARKAKLQASLEAQKFYTEIAEAEFWMEEKVPVLSSADYGKDQDTVQAYIKKLDTLERDIENFSSNIGELAALSRVLIEKDHYDTENIKQQQASVEKKYSQLQDSASQRRAKLNDAKKMYEFYREADEVAEWIQEKVTIASSEDYGQDLEHVEVLQQKFEDFLHELDTSEERITNITTMAKAMTEDNHFESEAIKKRSEEIVQMWAELREVAKARQEALAAAKQVHMYGRDADDTLEWIQEKDGVVSSEDYGHDLESVRALLSKHDALERDLAAISEQVEAITKEAERLIGLFPDAQEHIAAKHEEMVQAWNNLVEKATLRKKKLQQADQLQLYFNDYRELTAWISEMMAIITAEELARDLPGAEAMMTRCKEHKAAIDSHEEAVSKFLQRGQIMIDNGHFLSEEIQEKVTDLKSAWDALTNTFEQYKILCEQNMEAQLLKHEMEQLEAWMNTREPMLREKQFGENIQAVEELLRRQDDFEKTVDAQSEKFKDIIRRTQLEQSVMDQKQRQAASENARKEIERLEDIKRREQERILEERKREEEQRKAREVLLRRQKKGAESDSDNEKDDRLDSDQVKNLIGRSQSIKMKKSDGADKKDIRRAISFKSRGDGATSPPPVLPKALEFRQGEGIVNNEPTPTDEEAPNLPDAPPPEMQMEHDAEDKHNLKKKDKLSSPTASPKHKHVEHLKDDDKKKKRTPSFNLRRRTRSFKDKYKLPDNLPPVDVEGMLDRKQELQAGGKKATIRSWKNFYTVLYGQIMAFYKDKEGAAEKQPVSPCIFLHNATCEIAKDYTKKKHVFRLKLGDGADFLLEASSEASMQDWLAKINHYAVQTPNPADTEFFHSSNQSEETQGDSGGQVPDEQHAMAMQRSSSPEGGRGRSVSPLAAHRESQEFKEEEVAKIREAIDKGIPPPVAGSINDSSPKPSPRRERRNESFKEALESDLHDHSFQSSQDSGEEEAGQKPREDVFTQPPVNGGMNGDGDHITDEVKVRPKPSPRSPRPISEPPTAVPHVEGHDSADHKEKKHKSMFGFLKKKKDKDHDEHKDHKKHKKDKKAEASAQ